MTEVQTIEQPEAQKRTLGGIDIRAAIIAGLIAAVVFLILEMALLPLIGVSATAPLNMMAAMVMGTEVLPPAALTIGIFLTAFIIHLALSIIYAFILAAFINRRPSRQALTIGLIFGLVLFLVNFYIFTAFFPWFAEARNWVNVVAHLAFGATAAMVYIRAEAGSKGWASGGQRLKERTV